MNIECDQAAVDELSENFRYNDAVIRNMVLRVDRPITEPSPISREKDGRIESDGHTDTFDRDKSDTYASRKKEKAQAETDI